MAAGFPELRGSIAKDLPYFSSSYVLNDGIAQMVYYFGVQEALNGQDKSKRIQTVLPLARKKFNAFNLLEYW